MIDIVCQLLEKELCLEKNIFIFINTHHFIVGDYLFLFCSNYLAEAFIYISCFFIMYVRKKHQIDIILVVFSIVLVFFLSDKITSEFFKPIFHRLRPANHPGFIGRVRIIYKHNNGLYGFVSEHTTISFGVLTIISLIFQNRLFKNPMMIFSCLVGYSRIYLGEHFVSDVLVGALVGVFIGFFTYRLYRILYIKKTIYDDN